MLGHLPWNTMRSVLKDDPKDWYFDCSKAVKELGFTQIPIRKTIEKAVNWFRENGYLKKV